MTWRWWNAQFISKIFLQNFYATIVSGKIRRFISNTSWDNGQNRWPPKSKMLNGFERFFPNIHVIFVFGTIGLMPSLDVRLGTFTFQKLTEAMAHTDVFVEVRTSKEGAPLRCPLKEENLKKRSHLVVSCLMVQFFSKKITIKRRLNWKFWILTVLDQRLSVSSKWWTP